MPYLSVRSTQRHDELIESAAVVYDLQVFRCQRVVVCAVVAIDILQIDVLAT